MRHTPISIISTICIILSAAQPSAAASQRRGDDRQTVGLVLSGGGCKGIAHIGFIEALEENDIPIDYITGTSMGAIVGSLYAIGYSPREMLQLLCTPQFLDWATGVIPQSEKNYYETPPSTPAWVGINFAANDSTTLSSIFPTRLVNPLPMSIEFMGIYAPATGACNSDFNRLMVPYRCVASDVYTHRKVVFDRGELQLAVRASMSFPLVYQPIMIDGTLMYDGGLYDVYPVDVMMEDFKPDRVIGVDVSTPNTPPGPNDLMDQICNMVMSGYMYPFPDDIGVNVVFDLSKYGLTSWDKAATIYKIGYDRGMALADSLKSRISARRTPDRVAGRRRAFRAKWKPVDIPAENITVSGTDPSKAYFIKKVFHSAGNRATGHLDMKDTRTAYYQLASTGRLRNCVPHAPYDSLTGTYRLNLATDVNKDFGASVGGFLTSASQSMIYAEAHYNPMDYKNFSAAFEGWAGFNYLAASVRTARRLDTRTPQRIGLGLTLDRTRLTEHETMFYDMHSPAWPVTSRVELRAAWEMAAARHGILWASLAYGHLTSAYRPPLPESMSIGRKRIIQDLVQLTAGWRYSTLNDGFMPTSGTLLEAQARFQTGARRLHLSDDRLTDHPAWITGEITARHFFTLSSGFSLGTGFNSLISSQRLLPDYTASIINAPAFTPFNSTVGTFDPAFRANQWVAASVTPVWNITSMLQARFNGVLFMPVRRILPGEDGARYGATFGSAEFAGELALGLRLPFGAVTAYADYSTGSDSHWGAGISLGLLIRAPRFLR